LVCWL